ncbi:enoyl-CoA hydratase-related protein, partial [Thermomonas alba]|uniref:enoyl-CoA hydratase-related protein n=1 Tax=Thermomonas alba TaxID=2888525 RepID=UPI001F049C11
LALASDLRLGTERARTAFLFTRVGLAGADMGACALLPRVIGQGRAAELLFTGRTMTAAEGLAWGFFNALHAPEALAERAKANGVELWALTDHDEVGGQHRAAAAAHALGLPYLSGVEISVTFAGLTVHIVGLGVDPDDPQLVQGLAHTRGGRERRAREMADQLAAVGIRGAFEGALKYVGNPELISRTHFA